MATTDRKSHKTYKAQINPTALDELLGEEQPLTLPLTAIVFPESQPRRYFNPEKLAQLTESIKSHGILENLVVRPLGDEKYELVAGERRYRAAKAAGLTDVPVTIRKLTNEEALEIALIENLQREDLNPLDETEGMLSLLSLRLQLDLAQIRLLLYQMLNVRTGKTTNNVISNAQSEMVQTIFAEIGRMSWESFITNRLPLLKLPSDILEALRQGKIEYTKAKAIAKVKDEEARTALLEAAIKDSLSLSEIKARITALKPSPDVTSPQNRLQTVTRRLNQLKLWEKDKKTWKKVEGLLDKIEGLLLSTEQIANSETEEAQVISQAMIEIALIEKPKDSDQTEDLISEKNDDSIIEEEFYEDWEGFIKESLP
jgi:ParB family chromosome partitioning protein